MKNAECSLPELGQGMKKQNLSATGGPARGWGFPIFDFYDSDY